MISDTAPAPAGFGTPTGRFRLRLQERFLRPTLVVLQVHVTWGDGPPDHNGMPTWLSGEGWRDANPLEAAAVQTKLTGEQMHQLPGGPTE